MTSTKFGVGVWTGVEVEGRLSGVKTLFANNPSVSAESLLRVASDKGIGHVYLLHEWWSSEQTDLKPFYGRQVTFEVPVHDTPSVRQLAHHQSRGGGLWRLQFVFFVDPEVYDSITHCASVFGHELRVDILEQPFKNLAVPLAAITSTTPPDYAGDKEVML